MLTFSFFIYSPYQADHCGDRSQAWPGIGIGAWVYCFTCCAFVKICKDSDISMFNEKFGLISFAEFFFISVDLSTFMSRMMLFSFVLKPVFLMTLFITD